MRAVFLGSTAYATIEDGSVHLMGPSSIVCLTPEEFNSLQFFMKKNKAKLRIKARVLPKRKARRIRAKLAQDERLADPLVASEYAEEVAAGQHRWN